MAAGTGNETLARALLERGGTTFAEDAGIDLADQPQPLYQLLVLAMLLSARISGGIAVSTARELFAAGYTTPRRMAEATWQQRVDALGRGGYRRYDERTSTMLGQGAELLADSYDADVRRMVAPGDGQAARMRGALKQVPGIGDVGAAIFLREAQGVWPDLRPYLDKLTLRGAERVGLPADVGQLAALVSANDLHRLAAALVRVARDKKLTETVLGDAGG